jgi:hypothetical protein
MFGACCCWFYASTNRSGPEATKYDEGEFKDDMTVESNMDCSF